MMDSSPSRWWRVWRTFRMAMIVIGILTTLTLVMLLVPAYGVYRAALKATENRQPMWHFRLEPLVETKALELVAANDDWDCYEAIIHLPRPETREAFAAQIAARLPQTLAAPAPKSEIYRRFAAEYATDSAAQRFDLYAGCPYGKDKNNPTLVLPGRDGMYYIQYTKNRNDW